MIRELGPPARLAMIAAVMKTRSIRSIRSIRRRTAASLVMASLFLSAGSSLAAAPPAITQQGRLFQADGMPVSGPLDVVFSLHDSAVGGALLWSETHTITFDDGYFSVALGEMTPLGNAAFDGSVRYLGIQIGDDAEMSPRSATRSVPYALVASDAIGDITPKSVSIAGVGTVIDATGHWVGPPGAGPLVQVVYVNHTGDDQASGDALRAAIAGISDSSAQKRYVVRLSPGNFANGTSVVTMKPFVDLEGSGREVTTVSGTADSAVVSGASSSEIRDLGVLAASTAAVDWSGVTGARMRNCHVVNSRANYVFGVQIAGAAEVTLEDTLIEASSTGADFNGILMFDSPTVTLSRVDISGTAPGGGGGITPASGGSNPTVTVKSSSIRATSTSDGVVRGIVAQNGSTWLIQNSDIRATGGFFSCAVQQSESASVKVGTSLLSGATANVSGTVTCYASYGGNYQGNANPQLCP